MQEVDNPVQLPDVTRIDRIEEQFGIDTSDPELRFNFLLAYRVREALIVPSAQ